MGAAFLLFWSFLAWALPTTGSSLQLSVTSLTTEYLTNPLGVDVKNPRLSWKLTAPNGDRGLYQTSYQIQTSYYDKGRHSTLVTWNFPTVESSQSHLVPLFSENDFSGWELQSDTHYDWQVQLTVQQMNGSSYTVISPKASFRTGLWEEWEAEWITGGDDKTMLRATFDLVGMTTIQSHATLFISGVGYYEAYLNGDKVGDHVLDVGWTDYNKRVWYATYNATEQLLQSPSQKHVLGVLLGNGWWSCGPPPGTNLPLCSKDPPQLKLQLQVDGKIVLKSHADGRQWQAMTSPIVYNSLYNGETYDARIAETRSGWASDPDFLVDDSSPVRVANSVVNQAKMTSQLFEPIRHVSTLPAVSISILSSINNSSLTQIIDFGQNSAAVVRLKKIHCPRGTKVTLRHAEILTHPPYGPKDGSIYVKNLRTAKATDVYICSGSPKGESYTPTFTQHGFRYVEVTGLDYKLAMEDVEMVEVHTDVQQASTLNFSDPLLNQIQSLCYWGQKSNLMSVPTDCPQRDERRGWMGDAALAAEEAAYNFHMGAVYSHWLLQIVDDQAPGGSFPNYVPAQDQINKPGAPNWQSAFPTIVWVLVKYYGDRQVASQHHDALAHYVDYLEAEYHRTGIKEFRTGYGDWCPPPPQRKSNKHLMAAFALIHDLQLSIEIFSASAHPKAAEQAMRCQDLVRRIKGDYHEAFYNASNGWYATGLQTEQALSLFVDAVPDELRDGVLSSLVQDIQANGNHTTSGIIGIKFAMELLSSRGHSEVAFELARQTTYPSWGYMVNHPYEPATTVWELWNAPVSDPGMNSRNHIMFGSISSWFFKYLAGIQPLQDGYRQSSIRPTGQSSLRDVSAMVGTPYGDVVSFWEWDSNTATYSHTVTIPPGTNATLLVSFETFSDEEGLTIMEGGSVVWSRGRFISSAQGIVSGTRVDQGVQFLLLNGRYGFNAIATSRTGTSNASVLDENMEIVPKQ